MFALSIVPTAGGYMVYGLSRIGTGRLVYLMQVVGVAAYIWDGRRWCQKVLR